LSRSDRAYTFGEARTPHSKPILGNWFVCSALRRNRVLIVGVVSFSYQPDTGYSFEADAHATVV